MRQTWGRPPLGTNAYLHGGDTVTDFTSGADRFRIVMSGFGINSADHPNNNSFGGKQMDASYFVAGSSATALGHGQFIFNAADTAHQTLSWDSDGTGAAAQVLIADLLNHTVAHTDFDLR